ncbi:MAG: DUF1788 domain-containing protein [Planctomycetia bacterium]|nr:DUF1788 domain-containing protein [Planctomycetia bacterium]
MIDINERLDKVRALLRDPDFLESRGLSNEVNIRIFCYQPQEEMIVQHFVWQTKIDHALPCRLLERNLYQIFLKVCEEKRILDKIPEVEKKKGRAYLRRQLEKSVPVQSYVNLICGDSFEKGDVLLLTGVGDVFPFMRIHKLLEALQPEVGNVPVLVMYPGAFDGRHVMLFERLPANPYYRAFNVI